MLKKLSPSYRLALFYLIISISWILLSDTILSKVVTNIDLLQRIQSIKGLTFVCITAVLLYFISERLNQSTRASLNKSEELLNRYKALTEATKEGIVDLDLLNDEAVINEQMKFYMNEKSNRVEHFSLVHEERIHPNDLQRVTNNFRDTLKTNSTIWQADYRYLLFDGTYHDIINRGFIIRDDTNRPVRFISAFQDVSEIRNMRSLYYEQRIRNKQFLGQSIIKAQENERNRWSEELHDNVCQVLTVVKLYLDHLAAQSQIKSEMFEKTQDMITKALNDIRHLSAAIKPPEFSIVTLKQSIDQLISNVNRVHSFEYFIDTCELNEQSLSDEQKLMIYRVVQEQLNNIIKYAEAKKIDIIAKVKDNMCYVYITDDGKGFDPQQIQSGIGLRNIRSRLQMFSGSMEILSSPGNGCQLIAEFVI